MSAMPPAPRRGRPRKFGRPSEVIALTLPANVVRGLRRIHPDLGWAIVGLYEGHTARRGRDAETADAVPNVALVTIADRRSLIVVKRSVFTALPGIQIIPLDSGRAFLALEAGRGMSDLELAVIDRLDDERIAGEEREALETLRSQLRCWRLDPSLRFHSRGIIVVEHATGRARKSRGLGRTPASST